MLILLCNYYTKIAEKWNGNNNTKYGQNSIFKKCHTGIVHNCQIVYRHNLQIHLLVFLPDILQFMNLSKIAKMFTASVDRW